jgi:NitT/TauT family transport system substrate-binding protein
MPYNRRHVLAGLSAASALGLMRPPRAFADEPPPEVTTLRFAPSSSPCSAPHPLSEALLRAEGFTDIRHVPIPTSEMPAATGRGDIDFQVIYAVSSIVPISRGTPIVLLGGIHVGCFSLVGNDSVRSIADLKGKRVWGGVGPGQQFVSSMAAYVGLDPATDINWVDVNVEATPAVSAETFTAGKVDAFIGFPGPADPRATKIGHLIVDSTVDRPWSQYFCCMLAGNADFVRKHPIATKRVLRATLKSADLCATDPQTAARRLVDEGFTKGFGYGYADAVRTIASLPYDKWRSFDPEDSVRFWSLRLHEAGMIKAGPKEIIANGTDWRFLNELKRELKA